MKNDVFGVELYAPIAILALCPRYAIEPDADELIVTKNLTFGLDVYAPAFSRNA